MRIVFSIICIICIHVSDFTLENLPVWQNSLVNPFLGLFVCAVSISGHRISVSISSAKSFNSQSICI